MPSKLFLLKKSYGQAGNIQLFQNVIQTFYSVLEFHAVSIQKIIIF